jgi:hypothetical protein
MNLLFRPSSLTRTELRLTKPNCYEKFNFFSKIKHSSIQSSLPSSFSYKIKETWAVMEVPTEEKIKLINKAIVLLEPQSVWVPPKRDNLVSIASVEKVVEAKKIDRQVKVVLIILYWQTGVYILYLPFKKKINMIDGYGEMKIMIWWLFAFNSVCLVYLSIMLCFVCSYRKFMYFWNSYSSCKYYL